MGTLSHVTHAKEGRQTKKRVMSRTRMSHGTHMNKTLDGIRNGHPESWHTREWVMSDTTISYVSCSVLQCVAAYRSVLQCVAVRVAWHTCEWVMSDTTISYVTRTESPHTCEKRFMSLSRMSHGTHINSTLDEIRDGRPESCHTCEWVISYTTLSRFLLVFVWHDSFTCVTWLREPAAELIIFLHTCHLLLSHILSHHTLIFSDSPCPPQWHPESRHHKWLDMGHVTKKNESWVMPHKKTSQTTHTNESRLPYACVISCHIRMSHVTYTWVSWHESHVP